MMAFPVVLTHALLGASYYLLYLVVETKINEDDIFKDIFKTSVIRRSFLWVFVSVHCCLLAHYGWYFINKKKLLNRSKTLMNQKYK
jgi:hypothetical protein